MRWYAVSRDFSPLSIVSQSYDALANMHTGIALQSGHEGPGFLAWHREYLAA